jgi:hypothetical protein
MPVDQIEEALSQLDIGERALLDLSVHRGFDDDRIAKLLDIDASEVSAQRRAALEKLFRLRAASGDGARDEVRAELRSVSDSTWIDPATAASRGGRHRTAIVGAAILLVVGVVTAVVLLAGGSDSGTGGNDAGAAATPDPTQPSSQTGQPAPQPAQPSSVALKPLSSSTPGSVTASVSESRGAQRLTVQLRGLPAPSGAYELWLYDSLVHSRALGSVAAGKGSISARLPRDASSYSWLDLTLQPGADRVHHSGESVFRTPLDRVLAAARDEHGAPGQS